MCKLVYLVYSAEIGIVGVSQGGRDEQEGVTCIVQHLLCNVFTRFVVLYAEVMYRWHVSFGCLHGFRVDESPCGVWIVVEGEFLLLTVLLEYECRLELRLWRTLWNLHSLCYVGSHVVGTEIEQG